MAHGVEARVPLLDRSVVKLAMQVAGTLQLLARWIEENGWRADGFLESCMWSTASMIPPPV